MIDRNINKAQLINSLLEQADGVGNPISVARARKLAARIQRGDFDPELAPVIGWADPTGETACRQVMAAQNKKGGR